MFRKVSIFLSAILIFSSANFLYGQNITISVKIIDENGITLKSIHSVQYHAHFEIYDQEYNNCIVRCAIPIYFNSE